MYKLEQHGGKRLYLCRADLTHDFYITLTLGPGLTKYTKKFKTEM